MKIILNPYKDPAQGLDWHEQTPEIETRITGVMKEFGQSIDYSLQEMNIGIGADWPTIAVNVATIAGVGLFAIPEAHKRVREALEEWHRIGGNFQKLMDWLPSKEPLVSYPIEILFISASEALVGVLGNDDAVFIKYQEVEPVGSYSESCGLYEFQYRTYADGWKVVINGRKIVKTIEKV
ncbi:hypothetical protein [Citrifermentans bremense]|uniref:hypothetical protein n=1 Tax=Citrifermentans bremense TaxID=60035 RepID=UPI00047C1697|nr:hypothetical protein [Citrifermentans bremense]